MLARAPSLSHSVSRPATRPTVARRAATAKSTNPNVFDVAKSADWKTSVLDASNTKPIIVDFHAVWCGPCRVLGPRLEAAISKAGGKVKLAKVDIDDVPELAEQHNVQGVPTVIAYHKGKQVSSFVGNQPEETLHALVDKLSKL